MTAKKTRQTSRQDFQFSIPLEDVLGFIPAAARESLAGFDCDVYVDRSNRQDPEAPDDVVVVTFSKTREFEPDATGKMVEKPKEPRDLCARKSEVEKMIAEAKVTTEELAADISERVQKALIASGTVRVEPGL